MVRASMLTVLAIGMCLAAGALQMAPADQRIAVAELTVAFALMVAGPTGATMHENFPKAMGIALFAMGITMMVDTQVMVGYPYGIKIGDGVLIMTCFAGTSIGMTGAMWEACGREEAV